jgi:MFS family permease
VLPSSATPDASVLLQTRSLRAFVDGLVSVVLVSYLTLLGLDETHIGIVITLTLLGSAAVTLGVGLRAHAVPRRRLLQLVSMLMALTGLGFALATGFWWVAVVGFIGTLNPSGGDVSVFLPTEQALLPATASDADRTALFARYSFLGTIVGAVGAAAAGAPEWIARHTALDLEGALRGAFLLYALAGAIVLIRYRRLDRVTDSAASTTRSALGPSKRTVYRLAAVFSLDSFGGGFVITAVVVLWLQRRFDLSLTLTGAVFFWAGLLSAGSQLVAPLVARRIGLIRTMVFTHLPANALLVLAAFMPTAPLAIACLLGRAALSQMDVPARTSYVMAVVTPPERPAAASVTNVPRSLVSAVGPFAAGWLLSRSTFGWPLVIGGTAKAIYDLILLALFRDVRPPEERPA